MKRTLTMSQAMPIVLVMLALITTVSSDKGVFKSVITSLRHHFDSREIILVYNEEPILEGVSCQAVVVSRYARSTEVRMNYLNLARGVNLIDFSHRSSFMITALLALPDDQARSVLGQVMQTEWRRRVQLVLVSADPEVFLRGAYLPMDSRVVFLRRRCTGSSSPLHAEEAYHVWKGGPLRLGRPSAPLAELQRSDLRGVLLKCAVSTDSLDEITISTDPLKISNFHSDVWGIIEKSLNFSTELFASPKHQRTGVVAANGSWSGEMGKLQRNEADVSISGVTMTTSRQQVVDFTHIYQRESFHAYLRWPTTSYMLDLWAFTAVMLATVIVASFVQLMAKWLLPEPGLVTLSIVFDVFCAFCQQGVAELERYSGCTACAMLVAQLAGFLVYSIYSATLMSRLAVQNHVHTFESLASLASSSYAVVYLSGEASVEMTKRNFEKLNLPSHKLEVDKSQAIQKLCEDNYILVLDEIIPKIKQPWCMKNIASVHVGTSSISFALRKNSPYLATINQQLLKMREIGDIARLQRKWYRTEATAPPEPEHITIKHVMPCIVSLTLGITISVICLLAEWYLTGSNMRGPLSTK